MSSTCWQARQLPIPAAWPVRSSPAARQWAIISAALAPVLLTGGYLVAGAPARTVARITRHNGDRAPP
jgi:hypothetical protein